MGGASGGVRRPSQAQSLGEDVTIGAGSIAWDVTIGEMRRL